MSSRYGQLFSQRSYHPKHLNLRAHHSLQLQALEGKDVKDLLLNVGSGGGAAAAAPGGGAAGGAAPEAAAEETKEEAKEEGEWRLSGEMST